MLKNLAIVATGGALGAMVRYLLAVYLNQPKWELSWGTMIANVAGSFLMGMLLAYDHQRAFSETMRMFLMVGFCGALTTFSSFAAETLLLTQEAKFLASISTLGLHVVGSLLAVAAGYAIWGKWIAPV